MQKYFFKADSLLNKPDILYETFYNPSELAYKKFIDMRENLIWIMEKIQQQREKH